MKEYRKKHKEYFKKYLEKYHKEHKEQIKRRIEQRVKMDAGKEGGMNEYESMRRISYKGGAQFVPVCEKCGRFVTADEKIKMSEIGGLADEPNATCKKCGRTYMLFEGFVGEEGE